MTENVVRPDVPADVGVVTVLRAAMPSILVVLALLLPFLRKGPSIDDPLYLHAAEQALREPLNPMGFDVSWNGDPRVYRGSEIMPGGPLAAYVLVPAALIGSPEWAAHATQLLILIGGLLAVTLLALRVGQDARQSAWTSLLVGTSPAVLGVAGTVMPDILAMALGAFGAERWIAAHRSGHGRDVVLAAACLALAALSRVNLVLLPLLLPLLAWDRRIGIRILCGTTALVVTGLAVTTDPGADGPWVLSGITLYIREARFPRNAVAMGFHLMVALPLGALWLLLQPRRLALGVLIPTTLAFAGLLAWSGLPVQALLGALGFAFVLDLLRRASSDGDRLAFGFAAWPLMAVPVLIYLHFPSKYLLPAAPGLAIAVVRLLGQGQRFRWAAGATCLSGMVLGHLVLRADAAMSAKDKEAAARLIEANTAPGRTVWFFGQWGFHWYAERAGARPLTLGVVPADGDLIVHSRNDGRDLPFPLCRRRLADSFVDSSAGGRILSRDAWAGFFTPRFGLLPWGWADDVFVRYEAWRVIISHDSSAAC